MFTILFLRRVMVKTSEKIECSQIGNSRHVEETARLAQDNIRANQWRQ